MLALTQRRGTGMAQYDKAYFKKQFEGLPRKAVAVIALRAAMRVLPILAYRQSPDVGPFAYWKKAERAGHALALFRCYQISFFVNNLTKRDPAAATARDAAYAGRDASVAAATNTADAAYAAFAAGRDANATATAAAYAAYAAYAAGTANSCAGKASVGAAAAATFANGAGTAAAISADIERVKHLKRSWLGHVFGKEAPPGDIAALQVMPVWPEGEPEVCRAMRAQLETDLRSLNAGFEVWIDWYRDRLEGKPPDWEVERQSNRQDRVSPRKSGTLRPIRRLAVAAE